ncbi:MAG: RNA methyltransferase [Paludibacteraceae bacterium]|nr:RNA methyltransferase [Paludibacteraceae bacterium]
MLSKNKIKDLLSLSQKKQRDEKGLFIAEGNKLVAELLPTFRCTTLVATSEWLSANKPTCANIIDISETELKKISLQKTPQQVFAVFEKPTYTLNSNLINKALSLALDDIQDPGNMGTIIRIADWFGIENIFCSLHCADVYNPKTVQATMGAIARVKIFQVDLPSFLQEQKNSFPIFGTFLDGENMYAENLPDKGIIVMGNEGNGISPEVEQQINKRLFIPNYPADRSTSESLNVAVATAIVCAEFRRRSLK